MTFVNVCALDNIANYSMALVVAQVHVILLSLIISRLNLNQKIIIIEKK